MDFKVEFKDSFVNDLEQIVRRIAAHNPDAARNLGNLILDRCESLSFFPERYPKVRLRPGIRRFVVRKNFKIFYRVKSDVRLLRFCDAGTQDGALIPEWTRN